MNLPALDLVMLACPDDGGRLEPAGDELRCINANVTIAHLAAFGSFCRVRRSTPRRREGKKLESYRAGYSERPDRAWLQGSAC